MEVAACMTAVEQGSSAGEVMRRLTAEDYAVDAVTMAKALVGARRSRTTLGPELKELW